MRFKNIIGLHTEKVVYNSSQGVYAEKQQVD